MQNNQLLTTRAKEWKWSILMILLLIFLLISCSPKIVEETTKPDVAVQLYAKEVTAAARKLIELTPKDQRESLVYSFDNSKRISGRDQQYTPSFCAVLTWCLPGWGLQLKDMNQEQVVAMHKMLDLALSPGGYHTLLAVLNRQRIIGEMEEVDEQETIRKAIHDHPHTHANSIFDFDETAADEHFFPGIGGGSPSDTGGYVNWNWTPPGLEIRWNQFQQTTLAIFGEPGKGKEWGFRFEGHHYTINMTFLQDQETGAVRVHGTPLFFGSVPMIIPPSPHPKKEDGPQWNWEEGQLMMFNVAYHLRQFWLAVPQQLRDKAFISAESFPQSAPLVMDTPLSYMISSLDQKVNQNKIKDYPHIVIQTDELSAEALWNLKQAFHFYIGAMNPNISKGYAERVDQALSPGKTLTLAWAGQTLEEVGSRHYSYLVIDSFLLEFLQSNQFGVQHDPKLSGSHIHSMFRDLSFDWADPMNQHHHMSH